MRHRCETCDRIIMWNEVDRCEECAIIEFSNDEDRVNQERVNEGEVESRANRVSEARTRRRQRFSEIKIKGGVNKINRKRWRGCFQKIAMVSALDQIIK